VSFVIAVAAAAATFGAIHAKASESGQQHPSRQSEQVAKQSSFSRSPLRRRPLAQSTPKRAKAGT
jgi:hypothetical protein